VQRSKLGGIRNWGRNRAVKTIQLVSIVLVLTVLNNLFGGYSDSNMLVCDLGFYCYSCLNGPNLNNFSNHDLYGDGTGNTTGENSSVFSLI